MAAEKKRLDLLLTESKMVSSRQRARALILAGKVLVNHIPVDKAGALVAKDAQIEIKGEDHPFVSRGGLKLKIIFDHFKFSVKDLICMDVGASTGGFTDCLLQHGAKKVYAVDVGYGQLAWKLRQDPRVIPIERTNIRYLDSGKISDPIDVITVDASFISLKLVVPAALKFLRPCGVIIPLIKPQFEVGKGKVGKGGVVKDPALHQAVISDLIKYFEKLGLQCGPVIPTPILGPKGNQEFVLLLHYHKNHSYQQ
ncbi:MAG: TlyA family RNA methyltransferase [Desulfobacteraceae bacterium]|jgi:23S rRNA (cytidine1920-2'-O)/16S rRNA (cytidine1409-2'-O)-methyltransferase